MYKTMILMIGNIALTSNRVFIDFTTSTKYILHLHNTKEYIFVRFACILAKCSVPQIRQSSKVDDLQLI